MLSSSESEDSVLEVEEDEDSRSSPPRTRRRAARERVVQRAVLEDSMVDGAPVVIIPEDAAVEVPERGSIESSEGESDGEIGKKRRKKNPKDESVDEPSTEDEGCCCTICFEEFTNAGPHRLVCLKCGHIFGQSCIEKWIRSERNARCPQCKAKARISDVRKIFARAVKVIDTTELEQLKESNYIYKRENETLRLEVADLKNKLKKSEEEARNAKQNLIGLSFDGGCQPDFESCSRNQGSSQNAERPRFFTLSSGPVLSLSTEPGSRCVDSAEDFFVVTCRIASDIFSPYGLKLISREARVRTVIPVHSKRPRCCAVSRFDPTLVLSTGEDKTLCVTRLGTESSAVSHRFELPANGWSCCWVSENEVIAGLVNGRVLKFDLNDPTGFPFDLTNGEGRLPVIAVQWAQSLSTLFVVSIRELSLYQRALPKMSVATGAINSFRFDAQSSSCMLSLSPGDTNPTTEHVLYKVSLNDEGSVSLGHPNVYRSRSTKQTRLIQGALWSTEEGNVSAVFDEAHQQVVVIDWSKRRWELVKKINDDIVAIREIATNDPKRFRLACLSETKVHFLEFHC